MRLWIEPVVRPCTPPAAILIKAAAPDHCSFHGFSTVPDQPATRANKKSVQIQRVREWERLLEPIDTPGFTPYIGKKWVEYQGIQNWEGLLDPLDDKLRSEILRYGEFVEAVYKSFDFDASSPTYARCRFPKDTVLECAGLRKTGYALTKCLYATSGIKPPRWIENLPSWMATESSWIGYVAVCQDNKEISRLGRRDVVIAYRGTTTCLEWLENFRATLTHLHLNLPDEAQGEEQKRHNNSLGGAPMVESGFLSLYTSRSGTSPSLQEMVREEMSRLLQSYGDEPLSITITGHSLGAALATLTAYDIKTTFNRGPMVTAISFGCPRVGNGNFRCELEKQGTKVLRIVNTDDLITKVPGFVLEDDDAVEPVVSSGLLRWIQKRIEDTQWVYADVGRELRLCSRDSPYLNSIDFATCHDLKTYLHLVNGFVSSTCPYRATEQSPLNNLTTGKLMV